MGSNYAKYYLETNALYSLINKIDVFANSVDAATSLFAYEEILEGIDATNYHKRRVLLSKLKESKLKISPYLPMECIAIAFGLDISKLPVVVERKALLWNKTNIAISSEDYATFCKEIKEKENFDFTEQKKCVDNHESVMTESLKSLIMQHSNEIKVSKIRQKTNPEYYTIDVEDVFFDENRKPDREQERLMLINLLDSCGISYESSDIEVLLQDYDGRQLVAFILGQAAYTWNRSYHEKSVEYNDICDLTHLLYLKDENYIIVSNDKIYENATLHKMRIKTDEFLKRIENSNL